MISVILPIYHVENYIRDCLDSLIKQTYKDIEIICVDDCTQDNSITIVKEYQKKDKRIRLINHEENRGLGGARNTGIREAKGEFIVFIDSDDYLDKRMLERLYTALNATQSDAAVCGVMLAFESDHTYKPHTGFHYDLLVPESKYILNNKEILTDMWPSAWNKLYKTSIIKKYNIAFKERILYEDHTFFYEYFSHCTSFIYVNEPLYFYRQQRPQSITTQSVGREKEIFTILNYISDIFKNIYTEEQYQSLFVKIAVRLLYERRWVFHSPTQAYYSYLKSVAEYLKQWDKALLFRAKDSFIQESDPIFLSVSEISKMEEDSAKRKFYVKERILGRIKRLPIVKQVVFKKEIKTKYRNDFYWYIPRINENIDTLKKQREEYHLETEQSLKDLSQKIKTVKKHCLQLETAFDLQTSAFTQAQETTDAILALQKISEEANRKLEERISNLEVSLVSSKNKIDETWWLSWNIKDHIDPDNGNASFLRYYPTWIPTEFPEYFKGNIWTWSDNFKEYFLEHQESCKNELNELFEHLSDEDIAYLKLLWERNVKILPYSEYVKEEGFLIKRDFLFTEQELNAQKNVLKDYNHIVSKYILPEDIAYEIPVFYYEHGLKALSSDALNYIKTGDILDLGAFIGDSAIVLNKYTAGTIYSVEMNEENLKKMRLVLEMNHVMGRVTPIHGAVGNCDTEQVYYGDNASSTIADNVKESELYKKHSLVPVYKVDTLVSKYKMVPHFIKLDVEGAEYNAIWGAKETICRYRPILSISIYHTAVDFLKIKPLLESWNLNYEFRVENHNPFDPVYEKMLICIPRNFDTES